jgi:hypothetical protein
MARQSETRKPLKPNRVFNVSFRSGPWQCIFTSPTLLNDTMIEPTPASMACW